jgi:hypothetical protein
MERQSISFIKSSISLWNNSCFYLYSLHPDQKRMNQISKYVLDHVKRTSVTNSDCEIMDLISSKLSSLSIYALQVYSLIINSKLKP